MRMLKWWNMPVTSRWWLVSEMTVFVLFMAGGAWISHWMGINPAWGVAGVALGWNLSQCQTLQEVYRLWSSELASDAQLDAAIERASAKIIMGTGGGGGAMGPIGSAGGRRLQ